MRAYNYRSFPLTEDMEDFLAFPSAIKAGDRAPDGELIDASDGRGVKLSEYWADGPAVLEFGSVT